MALDPNRSRRQICLILVFLISCASLAMLTAAYSTEYWVEAAPVRNVNQATIDAARNLSSTKLTGSVRFGLFRGLKVLDNGLGPRTSVIDVFTDTRQQSDSAVLSSSAWTTIIVFGVFSGCWGIVSCGFALLNVSRKPVLGLSGPGGLYVWNLAWLICLLIVEIVFGAIFSTSLARSILSKSDTQDYKWTSDGLAWLSYSYWLLVGCCVSCLLNLLLTWLAGARLGVCCLPTAQRRGRRRGDVDLSIVY